jgi:uncharacterized membrane protein YccC
MRYAPGLPHIIARMSSANASLAPAFDPAPSFWSRESAALKQGIKTGLAGTITYAIYAGFHFRQGYWAVLAALVVTQANVGASWKAALYRVIGSTCGAVAAAVVFPALGRSTAGAGLALFLLASGFAYLTALHTAFTAAGITAAIILVFGGQGEPWHMAWLRVLYTFEGAFIAYAVGVVIWPVRAREGLRNKIAKILEGSGALYSAVTAAAMQGIDNEDQVRQLDRELHDLRRGITQQMDEARSELAFSRFNRVAYQQVVELADQIRRRLTAMAEDSSLYVHARVDPELVPSLPRVAEKTSQHFAALVEAIRDRSSEIKTAGLESAICDLDSDLARLRLERATAPFALDRMLPFWALVFNLREVAQDLKQLESVLPQLG